MSFDRADYVKVKILYEERRHKAVNVSEARRRELDAQYPEIKAVTSVLSETGPRIFAASLKGKDGLSERITALKKENLDNQAKLCALLRRYGYPEDYLDVKYECPICRDEGNIDGVMCRCMFDELVLAGYESSGIGAMIATENFDTFNLDYYPQENNARKNAEMILGKAKQYAESFSEKNSPSLLFFGGTGLGKTHLCVAIGKRVIERGYHLVYTTAQNMMAEFEAERFGRGKQDAALRGTQRYFACELLIIDDLGTENTGAFGVSTVYNLINTRINDGKATIINTNLDSRALLQRYDDRIVSRLFGEYLPYCFRGKDIRMQKLQKNAGL